MMTLLLLVALVIGNVLAGFLIEWAGNKYGFTVAVLSLAAVGAADAGIALFLIRPAPVILALMLLLPWSVLAGVRIRPTYRGEPFLVGDETLPAHLHPSEEKES